MADRSFIAPAGLAPVAVTGTDRFSYLEAVLSQHLDGVEPGVVTGALELDVHGGPVAAFDVAVLPDRLVLLIPEAIADEVTGRLGGRTFLADATFARLDERVLALRGEGAPALAGAGGLAAEAGTVREVEGVLVIGRDGGIDLVGSDATSSAAAERLRALGAHDGDDGELDAWRVHAGVPAWGHEIVAPHLPEELGLLPTHVHLAKGCYPGQEAVARMWMLGRPRRRLALVSADGEVEVDWKVGAGKRKVRVTSVADRDGLRRALAFVPGDAEPGQRFETDEGTGVEVLRLVGADAAVPGHDPTVPRRRDRA